METGVRTTAVAGMRQAAQAGSVEALLIAAKPVAAEPVALLALMPPAPLELAVTAELMPRAEDGFGSLLVDGPDNYAPDEARPSAASLAPDGATDFTDRYILTHWVHNGWCRGVVIGRNMNLRRVTKEGVINFDVQYADGKAAHVLTWDNYTTDPSSMSTTDKAPAWCFLARM